MRQWFTWFVAEIGEPRQVVTRAFLIVFGCVFLGAVAGGQFVVVVLSMFGVLEPLTITFVAVYVLFDLVIVSLLLYVTTRMMRLRNTISEDSS